MYDSIIIIAKFLPPIDILGYPGFLSDGNAEKREFKMCIYASFQ